MIISQSAAQSKVYDRVTKEMHIAAIKSGKKIWLRAVGSSMYPFVRGEDLICVERVPVKDIAIGDVLVIDNCGKSDAWFFAHRVVMIRRQPDVLEFITKGDANFFGLDDLFASDKIVGRVSVVERLGVKIDFRSRFWKKTNSMIAYLSLRHSYRFFRCAWIFDALIHWRVLPIKLISFIARGDLLEYNADGLILWCARGVLDKRAAGKIEKLLRRGVSWPRVFRICLEQKSFVMVFGMLKGNAILPDSVKEWFNAAIPKIKQALIDQGNGTVDIADKLKRAGCRVGVYDAVGLSEKLYGDKFWRGIEAAIQLYPSSDNYQRVREEVISYGYVLKRKTKSVKRKFEIFKKEKAISVVLWRNFPCLSGVNSGVGYLKLTNERQIVVASVAFVYNSFFTGLRYLMDVNAIIMKNSGTLDWDNIALLAKEGKVQAAIYATCIMCRKLLKTEIPQSFIDEIRPFFFKRLMVFCLANRKTLFCGKSVPRFFAVKVFARWLEWLV